MLLTSVLVLWLAACSVKPKMPDILPPPTGAAVFMSIASEHEVAKEYADLSIDELQKYEHYFIVDSKGIPDKESISAYISALKSGFGKPEAYAMCFEPRHALKYMSAYGEVEVLICFECGSAIIQIGNWSQSQYFVKPVDETINALYESYGIRVPLQRQKP